MVIVGGTSGMGLATAKMLLDGGARVLVTGRSKAGLESAQKELGKDALVVSSDARSLTEIDALASKVKAEFDTFDLLFVNAGFSIRAPLESITEAVYDEMFNLNTKGPFFAVQKLAPLIKRGGSIVFTTSIANVKGMPGNASYGAAKAALRSFARVLAAELLPRDIRVNAVSPGPIDTPILGKMSLEGGRVLETFALSVCAVTIRHARRHQPLGPEAFEVGAVNKPTEKISTRSKRRRAKSPARQPRERHPGLKSRKRSGALPRQVPAAGCAFRRSRPAIPSEAGRLYRLKPAGDSEDPGHLGKRALASASSSGQLAGASSS